VRLQEEQEAEARAQDRFQRAQTRLQRRLRRLERISGKLLFVRKQIADLQITDQQSVYTEPTLEIPATPESTLKADSEEIAPVQVEQDTMVAQESETLSPSHTESIIPGTSEPVQEATTISANLSDVFASNDGEEGEEEQGRPALQPEPSSLAPETSAPIEVTSEPEAATTSENTANAGTTLEAETLSPTHTESTMPTTSEPEQENTTINANLSDLLAALGGKEVKENPAPPSPQLETSSPVPLISPPVEGTPESEGGSPYSIESTSPTTTEQEPVNSADSTAVEVEIDTTESTSPTTIEQELVASADSTAVEAKIDATHEVDTSSDSTMTRVPTKPLRLEQEIQPAAGSFPPDILSAKEAWVAAESALQNARNAAHGIAASISFLSQSDGLSNELMEELVRKQADANKALLKAQDAARVAYGRFVEAQKDVEPAASQPVDTSMNPSVDHSQQKQENGDDQTAKLHAIRLYKDW